MNELFHRMAVRVSNKMGSPWAFVLAIVIILAWATTGPIFNFSDTWQLIINTGTTIITFLMVFLIQNTQNRDAKAMQLKLDELIRSSETARSELVDLEDLSDEELRQLENDFKIFHEQHNNKMTKLLHETIQSVHHSRRQKYER